MSIYKTLKSIALVTAIGLAVPSTVVGQSTVFDNPANRAYWGARIGLDVTCPGDIEVSNLKLSAFNAGAGFSAGAIYHYPIVANMFVEPGASLFYNTTGVDTGVLEANPDFELPTGSKAGMSIREFGLRVPVMIGYHFDFDLFSLRLFTGPSFDWGLRGREHLKLKQGSTTVTESANLYDDGFNSFDVRWAIGVGATIGNLEVDLSGSFGCRNAVDLDNVKWHRNLFQLTLGYNFR